MKTRNHILSATALVVTGLSTAALAAPYSNVLYSTDFETDASADFTTVTSGASPNAIADYNYSFSDFDGRTGTGAYFQAKTDALDTNPDEAGAAGVGGVLNALGGNLAPTFKLNFDVYTNSAYDPNDPVNAGTTEFAYAALNSDGTAFLRPDGSFSFYKSADGDSASDYRLYDGITNTTAGINIDPSDALRSWKAIEIDVDNGNIELFVDGVSTATTTYTDFAAGVPQFGQYDFSGGSSNDPSLQFSVFDNLVVSTPEVPEPATLGLLGMGALGLIRRRRSA